MFVIFACNSGFSQSFSATPNLTIPDDGTAITTSVMVSGLPATATAAWGLVQVCLNIAHPYDSDMEVRLFSPDGTQFLLFTAVGAGDDNFENTCLRADATQAIYSSSAPFTGVFQPMGNMGNVNNGQNPNGEWILQLYDTYAWADQGFLTDWTITFGANAPEPFTFPGTHLPLLLINSLTGNIPNDPKVEADFRIIDHSDGSLNLVTDTNFSYNGKILVELQGFTGPSYPKKNYDFDLIDVAGNKIDVSLLGMPAENDWILKAEYLDSTLLNNTIAYEFSRRMGRYAPRTRFCELFVDNDYVGVFTLTEKVKRGENRVNIANLKPEDIAGEELTGGYIFEMNINGDPADWTSIYVPVNDATCDNNVEFKHVDPKSDEILPVQHQYIKAWVDSFEMALHQPGFDDSLTGYHRWINMESFVDFMIVNEFSTNYDSYGRSTYLYKNKSGNADSLLNIGPPWDYDRAFMNIENWVWEETHPYWPFPDWWQIMHSDSAFLKLEWCRWHSLRDSIFQTQAFITFIDSLHNLLMEPALRNFQRWPELGYNHWSASVTYLKDRLAHRLLWMDNNITGNYECDVLPNSSEQIFNEAFSLYPNPAGDEIVLTFSPETSGIRVLIKLSDFAGQVIFSQYYSVISDFKLQLSAIPPGIYLIEVQTGKQILHKRFIKY
jgi:subtilisin-like proprotein convertase family protein